MKLKYFVLGLACCVFVFGCGKTEEKDISVAGIDMGRIPDRGAHKGLYF